MHIHTRIYIYGKRAQTDYEPQPLRSLSLNYGRTCPFTVIVAFVESGSQSQAARRFGFVVAISWHCDTLATRTNIIEYFRTFAPNSKTRPIIIMSATRW